MIRVVKIFSSILFVLLVSSEVYSLEQIVLRRTVSIKDINYSLTLEKGWWGNYEIWAREKLQTSSVNDVKIASVSLKKKSSLESAKGLICKSKPIYDKGKMILGCASTAGTGICVISGGGGGVGALACVVAVKYTVSGGFVDCLSGIGGLIGNAIGSEELGSAIYNSFGKYSISDAISQAIDEACDDWERNK